MTRMNIPFEQRLFSSQGRIDTGWNLKKLGQLIFSTFNTMPFKVYQKIRWLAVPDANLFDIFFVTQQELFVHDFRSELT